ncbi:MAG: putative arylesterase [Bacteroidota bacterium]|nr:putative arylesterase [Bacteroidota bacterium]
MLRKFPLFCIILCSIFACQKQNSVKVTSQVKTGPGPEDIVEDKPNQRLLVSCNERRTGMPEVGEIFQVNLSNDASTVLPRTNYPNIPFNPHGFDLQTVNGIPYLYVINHYHDSLSTSSIVQFKINAADLEFIKEYKDALLISPNDLTVLPNGSFYYSNDKSTTNILELLTNPRGGSIGYCDGNTTWKIVDSHLAYPNGLYNENNRLYLATSRNTALFTYDIQTDGTLKNRATLSTIDGMDNITPNGDELIVAVHPNLLEFALLSLIPTTLSPSRTFAINKYTGETKNIFKDDGTVISGSSTGLVIGNTLYLSQVFGDFLLKIENYRE